MARAARVRRTQTGCGESPARNTTGTRICDLCPLNPEGDLLALVMIESVEGLQNLNAIASTPGVGALFVGAANDLTRSMGVRPGSPEVQAGLQRGLSACKAHTI